MATGEIPIVPTDDPGIRASTADAFDQFCRGFTRLRCFVDVGGVDRRLHAQQFQQIQTSG